MEPGSQCCHLYLLMLNMTKTGSLVLLKIWQSKYPSVEQAELEAVLLDIKEPVNIVSDSQYAVKVTSLTDTCNNTQL